MTPDDQLVRAFRARRERRLQESLAETHMMVQAALSLCLIGIAGVVATDPAIVLQLRLLGLLALPTIFVSRKLVRRYPRTLDAVAFVAETGFIAFIAYLCHHDLAEGHPGSMASSFAIVMASMYILAIAPGSLVRACSQAVIFFGLVLAAAAPFGRDALLFIITSFCGGAAGVYYRYRLSIVVQAEGVTELRLLSATAPSSVVRQVGKSLAPVEEIFKATPRPCVCLSSDWRGYQKLSTQLTPERLAQTLEAYYALCERLLAETAPDGDYYFDWIADELFVVFFDLSTDGAPRDLGRRALTFAMALLDAKAAFLFDHPAPAGIDIGVGAGTALIGMLGAPGMSKVTAAGPMQAHVRQLQNEAKALRKRLGDRDRVVFGEELRDAADGALVIPGREGRYYLESAQSTGTSGACLPYAQVSK